MDHGTASFGIPLRADSGASPIAAALAEMHARHRGPCGGAVATYIPELAKTDPALFGIVLATADGQIYTVGDADHAFTIQSISKPLVYGLALEDHGEATVLRKVGVEPTGEAFNSIVMDEANNRPFNPMVNAGAIATAALIRGDGFAPRLERIIAMLSRFAGRRLEIDHAVFSSEQATGHRNRAIAFLQLNSGMIDEPVTEHLDLYFNQCSVLVTARDLAVMAATLANHGVNPLTGARALDSVHVKSVLSVMASCGMYDASGEWLFRVGLPAKRGVSGGIMAVLPGQFGLGVFSPPLDVQGNSCRGIKVCEEFSRRFNLHLLDPMVSATAVLRRSYRGGAVQSKRLRRAWQRSVIDRTGGAIVVYQIQGDLYFASVEQLLRQVSRDLPNLSFCILDGQKVGRADGSALALIQKMREHLGSHGKRLALAGFPAGIRQLLSELPGPAWPAGSFFADADSALEWCEDRLIAACDPGLAETETVLALPQMDILQSLLPEQVTHLAGYLIEESYAAGSSIIREGDPADRLFLLAAGSAAVYLRVNGGERSKRLAAFAPGVAFGELAMFEAGRRTADVIAETDARCFVLTLDRLAELRQCEPAIYDRLLIEVGRSLADRLRRAVGEIRTLEG
jgi:glutaminase